jgi:hypothetical protein
MQTVRHRCALVRAGSGNEDVPPPRRRPGPRSTVCSSKPEATARPCGCGAPGPRAGRGGRWPWPYGVTAQSRAHPAGGGRGVSLCHVRQGRQSIVTPGSCGSGKHMHSPAPAHAGAPINRPFLWFRGQRPTRWIRSARPRAGRALAEVLGATVGPGPILRGVAEPSASAMGEGALKHRHAGFVRIREIHVVSPRPCTLVSRISVRP